MTKKQYFVLIYKSLYYGTTGGALCGLLCGFYDYKGAIYFDPVSAVKCFCLFGFSICLAYVITKLNEHKHKDEDGDNLPVPGFFDNKNN